MCVCWRPKSRTSSRWLCSVAVVDAALAGACISAMAAPRAPSRWRRQGRGEFADRPIAVADRVGWLRGLLGASGSQILAWRCQPLFAGKNLARRAPIQGSDAKSCRRGCAPAGAPRSVPILLAAFVLPIWVGQALETAIADRDMTEIRILADRQVAEIEAEIQADRDMKRRASPSTRYYDPEQCELLYGKDVALRDGDVLERLGVESRGAVPITPRRPATAAAPTRRPAAPG